MRTSSWPSVLWRNRRAGCAGSPRAGSTSDRSLLKLLCWPVVLMLAGCMGALEDQTKPTGSIVGKKTGKVGEYKGGKKSRSPFKITDPLTGGAQAYRPMVEQIAKQHVEHALRLFHAEHERYPKDHAEFMEKIIKEGGIQLPDLGSKHEYQYDVENHELVIVEKKK